MSSGTERMWSSIHQPHHLWKQKMNGASKIHNIVITMMLLGSASFFIFTLLPNNTNLLALSNSGVGESVICDFNQYSTGVCELRGDVRVKASSSSTVAIFTTNQTTHLIGKIKPYTGKWPEYLMKTIKEVSVISLPSSTRYQMKCDVRHRVPAVIFSTGGYTLNPYHAFNNGLVPLYITSERFRGEVIFMVQEFQDWWPAKYSEILRQLTNYPIINLNQTQEIHCFTEVIVGLKFHGELFINISKNGRSMSDFQKFLGVAYNPENRVSPKEKPRLVVLNRKRTRTIVNLNETVELVESLGFEVQVVVPDWGIRLAEIYRLLQSADVVVGVHGAQLTHLIFMRPNSTFVQIIPLGLADQAASCYGEPAERVGLRYIKYNILSSESTLSESYGLDQQNVRLSLPRIQGVLEEVLRKRESDRFLEGKQIPRAEHTT